MNSNLAEQIRAAIRQSGVSSYDLARHATVDASIIGRFLRGERSLTLETADRLLTALGRDVTITGEPSPESLKIVKRKRKRKPKGK